jgi:hypothetical protein
VSSFVRREMKLREVPIAGIGENGNPRPCGRQIGEQQ